MLKVNDIVKIIIHDLYADAPEGTVGVIREIDDECYRLDFPAFLNNGKQILNSNSWYYSEQLSLGKLSFD